MKKLLLFGLSLSMLTACGTKDNSSTIKTKKGSNTYSTINTNYIDKSVSPKSDFFQYANGEWVKNNPVPASESRWGSFNELDKANKIKITKILDKAAKEKSEKGTTNQLLGDYYTSFISMETRNKVGFKPIADLVNNVGEIRDKRNYANITAILHERGISAFFGFGIGQDLKDVDNHITYFGQGGIGLPNKNYYFDKDKAEIKEEYQKHIVRVFELAKIPDAKKRAEFVLQVESRLANNFYKPDEMRQPELTYNKMGRNEIIEAFGDFNFENYLGRVGAQSFDTIIVGNVDYPMILTEIIETFDVEATNSYLQWCILNHYAGHLNQDFVDLNFDFYGKTLSGKSEMKPIKDRAINEITGMPIAEALGKAFVEEHFSEEAMNRVNTMVDNLLIVFEERINNLDWMTSETKRQALQKLNAIGRKLGYPSKWEDFSSIDISASNYIQNIDNLMLYSHKKNMSELNKPVDKEEWGMPAHMVNAYYHPLLNEIAFPAGIMQPPFFDVNAEDAVNYGSIGMVIGHEFTHGFDDMGSKFAADGSFTNWWSADDRKAFEERTSKLGQTFEAFCPIDGHCVNPNLTMGENIADLGGITLAYHAYTRTPEFKKNEIREGFTPAQRFFISYAQLWKINYTEEELKNRLENDSHSPGMYRVNGPLMNCPEFFAAFDVQTSDKMRNDEAEISKIW